MYYNIGDELRWKFTSDGSVNGWGWRFTVYPLLTESNIRDLTCERSILCLPSIDLVVCLVDHADVTLSGVRLPVPLLTRLAAALASCAESSYLGIT